MIRRAARLALVAVYALLWLGGVAVHGFGLTLDHAPAGAAAFLLCAALLVVLHAPGARGWLMAVGVGGFLAELAGSRTGLPFGAYSYTGALQPQLAGVPVVMFCAWVILIAYVKSFDGGLPARPWLRVAAGALWMVAIDLAIEPLAAGPLGYWHWHASGPYYGVPWQNFAGWFLVSALLLAAGRERRIAHAWVRAVGLSVVIFFGALGAFQGLPAPPAAALVLSALHFGFERRPPVAMRSDPSERAGKL